MFSKVALRWKNAWKLSRFRVHLCVTVIILAFLAIIINYFFEYIQLRLGYSIADPVLKFISARDVSVFIFGLVYGAVLLSLGYGCRYPFLLLKMMESYGVLVVVRMCTIFFVPLEPDAEIIPLVDPIVDRLFYNEAVITKDLFFSGHVSTVLLLVLLISHKSLRLVLFLIAIVIAVLLLFQHAHYTADIIAAPFFSWMSFRIAGIITAEFSHHDELLNQ